MALSEGFSDSTNLQTRHGNKRQSTLLFVDDEREITASLADQFHRNYHVVTAADANEALAILKLLDVSVIVADQRMPGKTGTEMLAEARLINPNAVRILLTGYADIEATIQAVNEGQISFYLKKPWRSDEMEAIISKAVECSISLHDNNRNLEELRNINSKLEEQVKVLTVQLEQCTTKLKEARRTKLAVETDDD